jgi:hypothetical protein
MANRCTCIAANYNVCQAQTSRGSTRGGLGQGPNLLPQRPRPQSAPEAREVRRHTQIIVKCPGGHGVGSTICAWCTPANEARPPPAKESVPDGGGGGGDPGHGTRESGPGASSSSTPGASSLILRAFSSWASTTGRAMYTLMCCAAFHLKRFRSVTFPSSPSATSAIHWRTSRAPFPMPHAGPLESRRPRCPHQVPVRFVLPRLCLRRRTAHRPPPTELSFK